MRRSTCRESKCFTTTTSVGVPRRAASSRVLPVGKRAGFPPRVAAAILRSQGPQRKRPNSEKKDAAILAQVGLRVCRHCFLARPVELFTFNKTRCDGCRGDSARASEGS